MSWKVKEDDVRAVIQAGAEANDVDLLLWFVSNPPNDECGTGPGPATVYIQLCEDVVFPYLAEHTSLAVVQTICDTLFEKSYYWQEYYDSAFEVLEKAGVLAAKPMCEILLNQDTQINLWKRAIEFVRNLGEKEAVSSIVMGMKNVHPKWSFINKESAIAKGVQALMTLDAPAKGDVFYDLLSQDDKDVKQATIRALGHYGDEQAVQALKKRLGGIFKKPETATYLRNEIAEAIEKINSRGR